MIADTLVAAMPGLSPLRAGQLVTACNQALELGQMTSVNRAAMFLAQVGEESGSLLYAEELASGAEYEGRTDLGNTQPGDGIRFKGRSFIQITGRANYLSFSGWAHARGLVPSSDFFIRNPAALAMDMFAWYGPVWYFTVARPNLNALADAGDVVTATREINGGLNGLDERTARWNRCRALGSAILPAPPAPPPAPAPATTDWSIEMFVRFPKAKNPNAIYLFNGATLLWLNPTDFNAVRAAGPLHDIANHGTSNIYRCPIVPGTVDPRK